MDSIAVERGMARSTIEGHIAHYISIGAISPEGLVAADKISTISEWFLQNKPALLSTAKAGLGDNVSYMELRFVLSYLIFTKQISPENHTFITN